MTAFLWSTGLERKLQDQLSSTNTTQMTNRQHIQNIDEVKDNVQQQHQSYNRKVDEIQNLLEEIKQKLDQAKNDLRSAVRSQNHTVHSDQEKDTLTT